MYALTLFLHSWLRWIIVILAVMAIFRSLKSLRGEAAWNATDRKLQLGLIISFDVQVLLGLLLYFVLSPIVPPFSEFGSVMKVSALRFFAVEHVFVALLAVATLHVGSARAKRANSARVQHRRWLVTVGITLLLVLAAIPWPIFAYGRPLLRGF